MQSATLQPAASLPISVGSNLSDTRSVAEPLPFRQGRNLVICLDGTLNSATNVLQLFTLCSEDPLTQIRHYQTGVGVELTSWKPGGIVSTAKDITDSAIAYRLGEHITLAYRFLVQSEYNYWQPQDRIFVFGFSRGAYAARCLAGMIEQVGLLSSGNESCISLAYHIYKSEKYRKATLPGGLSLAKYFSTHFSRQVQIEFMGCWDTVSSIGAFIPRDLPFSNSSSIIQHFRQAVALDEHRCLYKYHPHHCPPTDGKPDTTVKEVFFVGSHSDVGGGAFPAIEGPSLSNLSLKWMLQQAVERGLKLSTALDADPRFIPFRTDAVLALDDPQSPVSQYLATVMPQASPRSTEAFALALLYLANDPQSPTAIADARAPRSDTLSFKLERNREVPSSLFERLGRRIRALGWNIAEIAPLPKRRWSMNESRFKLTVKPGFSARRRIPADAILHESVKIRQETPPHGLSPGNNKNVPERIPYTPRVKYKDRKKIKRKEKGKGKEKEKAKSEGQQAE
ncbi:hypothetical protein JCM3765_000788 [Sporobolomyces pararoseus]